jgi:hypothetical protein
LNPAAFAQPALGTLGNMGASNVLGPRYFQFDVALVREFPLHENVNLQVRAEAFNLFNNVRFNNLNVNSLGQGSTTNTTLSAASTFGTITGAQDPRILQLALKLTF